jgi:hypothetical protein
MSSVHLNNLCSPTKFCSEKTFFVACVKKTKNGHVNSNVGALKFIFLQRPQKMSFSHKTA